MKEAVLKYLQSDRSFGAGINLYQGLPGANRATVATLLRSGGTKSNLEQLHYDLAKLAGITERELQVILSKPKEEALAPKTVKVKAEKETAEVETSLEAANWQELSYKDQKALVKTLNLDVADQKSDTLKAALEAHFAQKKS